jgi:flagellar motor switch protein FliG
LLEKVLGKDRVDNIMEEIRGPAGRTMWDKLANVNESVLANFLKNEYPQTVSVVLSKIKPEHAARCLGQLPEAFAMEVIMRMLRMESVQKEILDDVERTLRSEFMRRRWPKSSTASTAPPSSASPPPWKSATATRRSASKR